MMDIDHFVNSFIENNADMPGMDEFAKLMYRGPLPERLDQAENMIKEYKATCKQIKWEDDEEKNAAYETLFLAYTTLIRLYETNCMYRLSINTALDAIDTMPFAPDTFLSILMHDYAYLQDIKSAEDLYNEMHKADMPLDADLLLPLSVLYFTLGDYSKSVDILDELLSVNNDAMEFILDWKMDLWRWSILWINIFPVYLLMI